MSKKLMLLALGALTVLAMTAVPSAASANEFVGTCSSGASCKGAVESTGIATLEEDSSLAIECSSTTGTVTQNHNSSTGTAQLLFHGCKDEIFKTECHSIIPAPVQPSGTITTNNMITHLVYIHPNQVTPGVLITDVNVTFKCPIININKKVTGNIIGEFHGTVGCGSARANHTLEFKASTTTTGSQTWTQITTTGTVFDLTVGSSSGNNPEVGDTTASQAGTAHINYLEGKTVTLDC